VLDELDFLAERLTGQADDYPTPGVLARTLEPRTVQTPALDLIDAALVDAAERRKPRVLLSMPPQEGKSQRVSRWFVLWLLLRNPDLRIGIVSYSDALARRWGRQVRNEIVNHPELGLVLADDSKAANEWQLQGHDGGVITVGVRGSLTGRPIDVLILDDLLKGRKEAESEVERDTVKDFWTGTGAPRLSEDAIVVAVATRWHQDDFIGWQLTEDPEGWRHINIPALADHSPEKGESDLLGREPGEWMVSARGRTVRGWEKRRRDAGSRDFAALFQGRPSPAEGGIIKRGWWVYYPRRRAVQRSDGTWHALGAAEVIQTWDLTFKDTKGSDWVVGLVIARRGSKAWLLDRVKVRADFPTTCQLIRETTAKWPQAAAKYIEDKANGPAVIAQLRKEIGGIIAVTPEDSKEGRAHAVTPFIEAGDVEIPDASIAPWVGDFVEECAAFPNGAHDDQVDALTQGLHRLFIGKGGAERFMRQLLAEQNPGPGAQAA
jgi:predicted phage terminase large subunit-like protein